jgi:hypothetical protein
MLPLAAGSGLTFVFVVVVFAVLLLVVLFRADDRDHIDEKAEADGTRPNP